MDPRLAIAMAALATSNPTLGAEAARSQNVITRQYAMAALAQGGSYPAWLPQAPSGDRPLIYADFANGNYWANGAVQTDAIFVQNTDWSPYSAANIIAGSGLSPDGGNGNPVIDPAFLSTALEGCTVAAVVAMGAGDPAPALTVFGCDLFDIATFAFDAVAAIRLLTSTEMVLGRMVSPDEAASQLTDTTARAGTVALAATFSLTDTAGSAMGSSVVTASGSAAGVPPDNIGITLNPSTPADTFLQTFAVYAPQPDADLPTLSTP